MRLPTKLKHFFIPHEENRYKAHALRVEFLLVYVFLLIGFLILIKTISSLKPGILGISSSIKKEEIVEITNQKRKEVNLPPLGENPRLSKAATDKAFEMLSQGYWAHNSPKGKKPWDFIKNSGYNYLLAGENLAIDFSDSTSVVNAWMSSPTHKANILEPGFKDIGVAAVSGSFNGFQTTLVVQMFGEPRSEILAHIPGKTVEEKKAKIQSITIPIFNQHRISQFVSLLILSFLTLVLLIDAFWVTRRKIMRLSSHSGAHFLVLALVILFLAFGGSGQII